MNYERKAPSVGQRPAKGGTSVWRHRSGFPGGVTKITVGDPASAALAPMPQASKRARILAKQRNVDLAKVMGSGPGGRIEVADVKRASGVL